MRISRSLVIVLGLFWLGTAFAANPPAAQTSSVQASAILPPTFGGWQMQGQPQTSTDPASADPANAGILKEYGFQDFASATYTRDDGRTVKIRAARFADASGAFGAFTFYLQPEMLREQIGDQAASTAHRRIFYRGHVLVDAEFSQESAMSAAQLRELAGDLPRPSGNAGNLPNFIEFMPHQGYIANTQKYAMGPVALRALGAPVSVDLVDFGASSEVTLGHYNSSSGEVTLMLISYPTPQLAAEHLRRIDAAHQLAQPQAQAGVSTVGSGVGAAGPFFDKRTGPIVAVATGSVAESDAKALLGLVNYEASVTWNQATDHQQVRDLTMLVLNIVILCAIVGAFAIIAGVAFGGIRILMKRYFPDRVFDRPEQMEFISLRLTETVVKSLPPVDPEASR